MNSAVERAIKFIWEHYGEQLSLGDIAHSALLSPFHFSRTFKEETGVSPGRFLSAVRIYQAKRMLLNTAMSVTDIAFSVGFNSLGSFTNHFTDSVSVSPGRFRRISANGGFEPPGSSPDSSPLRGTVAGTVTLPAGYASASVYVGIFNTAIVQRLPSSASVVEIAVPDEPSTYRLVDVPEGTWFLHAVAVAETAEPEPWTTRALLVACHADIKVISGTGTHVTMALRPRRPTDLPILLALPDLESTEPVATPAMAEYDIVQPW